MAQQGFALRSVLTFESALGRCVWDSFLFTLTI